MWTQEEMEKSLASSSLCWHWAGLIVGVLWPEVMRTALANCGFAGHRVWSGSTYILRDLRVITHPHSDPRALGKIKYINEYECFLAGETGLFKTSCLILPSRSSMLAL